MRIPLQSQSRGFTLIEVMVVIAIIGLLSSIVLGSLTLARERARISAGLQFDTAMYHTHGDNMQAEYLFKNNLLDSTGLHPGTSNGNVTYSSDSPINGGTSAQFNSGYVVSDIDVSETAYTVSLWFKTSSPDTDLFEIGVNSNTAVCDREIKIVAGQVCGRIWSNWNVETTCSAGQAYGDNRWHHLLHTYGGKTGGQEIYIDGKRVLKGNKNYSNFDWQTKAFIGGGTPCTSPYTGLLSEVRIYQSAFNE